MSRKKKKRIAKHQPLFAPGDKVLIRLNPYHLGAKDIVGSVVCCRPGEGFAGSDLVDVRYKHPRTGKWHTRPFGLPSIEAATPISILILADRHEATALALRRLLTKLTPT
ncbi:MAG: hypothetical protein AB7F75_01220 [Planctomycetota bacterium]